MEYDYCIIGAGIIGLTLAHELKQKFPKKTIVILEKEADVAFHASGRNSGVLHAGFYYDSNALKAKYCVEGNQLMKEYCLTHKLALNPCQKLVVAQSQDEVATIERLYQQGLKNGVQLELIDEKRAKEIDENVRTHKVALLSPNTASVMPLEVCFHLKNQLIDMGVEFKFHTAFLYMINSSTYGTSRGMIKANFLINCSGAYADKIATKCGIQHNYTLIPFKGLYLKYSGANKLIKTNVYPVPHPLAAFLGVHYTLTGDGHIKIGPTATPAFGAENYQGLDGIEPEELFKNLYYQALLFLKDKWHFRKLAFEEIRKYNRSFFVKQATNLLHKNDETGFVHWTKPGIRSQLIDKRTLDLKTDFIFEKNDFSFHMLNAVSPGFTCSFAIAKDIVQNI